MKSVFRNARFWKIIIGIVLLLVMSGAAVVFISNLVWEDDSSWKNPQFNYFDPGTEAGELKLVINDHNDKSQTIKVENCTLFSVTTENDVTKYVCTTAPLAEVVRNPGLAEDPHTHIVVFDYIKDKTPLPEAYVGMDSLSEFSFIGTISDPVQVNFTVSYIQNKPEKSLLPSIIHAWNWIVSKQHGLYTTTIRSWKVDTTKTISQLTFYPTPENIEAEVLSPWAYSDDEITPTPALPAVSELENTFASIVRSVKERNFSLYEQNAVQNRVWQTANNGELAGFTKEGTRVLIHRGLTGEQNWKQTPAGTCGVFATMSHPQVEGVQFVTFEGPRYSSVNISAPDSSGRWIMVFPDGRAQYVQDTGWRYQLLQTFYAKQGEHLIAKADISFAYDNGKWRYYGGLWEYNYDYQGEHGAKEPANVTFDGNEKNEYPSTIEISEGQVVAWKNLYGMVTAIDPIRNDYWGGMTLLGGTFKQKFDVPGEYTYRICSTVNERLGKVIVK
ncbi:MAG: hypothetical protein QY314_03715 [Candidatus Dojkabacteria bacterium]|nr:MAG: hypothetical protein QY314_03715 [Candidatus Dojkabacteria bacterium]